MKMQELTRKREDHIKSCRANNDNSHQIIADMYSDPSHFIYELLQNAEDAEATSVEFLLSPNKLIVKHNGRDFTFEDIDAITSIGNSTKKDEVNKIGKFGAGFKSVFSITSSPQIFSGQYNFEIVDFIIPKELGNSNADKTIFVFPFNHSKRKPENIYELINKKLKKLENEVLLFLKNIKEIIWQTSNENGVYLKEHQTKYQFENIFHEKVYVTSEINNNESNDSEFYLFGSELFLQNKNLTVNIAYKIENNQIIKADSPFLSVFFPTKIQTDLDFLVHAPFKTTPNRETIPFDDEDNVKMKDELAELCLKSLQVLKENGFITPIFLNTLPLKKAYYWKPVYTAINLKLVDFFKTYRILPTTNGEFIDATEAILARGKELINLLQSEDLEKLFSRKHWLSTEITRDNTNDLRTFIISELNIPEKDFEDFAREIQKEFLQEKTDEWLINFYYLLVNQGSLFNKNKGILRYRNIFKLDNDEFAALYDNSDRLNIYLPRKDKSNYKVVKKIFIENELSKAFFEKYNVSYPDRLAELKEFIAPKYSYTHERPFDEFISDLEKIIQAYNSADKGKQDIIDLFKNKFIILTVSGEYQQPDNTYIPTDELKKWFNTVEVNFISEKIYKDNLRPFFEDMGSHSLPKRIEIEPTLNHNDKEKLTNGYHSKYGLREITTKDFNIDGLDFFLKEISNEKSFLLWNILRKHFDAFPNWGGNFFKGIFKWLHHGENTRYFSSFFLNLLNETSWLLNNNNQLVKASEITISELSKSYETDEVFLRAIDELFLFKTDDVKKLEEKGYFIVSKEEKDAFEEWKRQQENQKEKENSEWHPKYKPEEVELVVEKYESDIKREDLSNQINDTLNDDNEDEKDSISKTSKTTKQTTTKSRHSKEIGVWGEEAAFRFLTNKFNSDYEIIWLNENGNVGKGYDFVIKKNNVEEFYYEVKTKTELKPELMEISGTQWEWARTLYDKGIGEKYIICVVLGAGQNEQVKIREIDNPIDKWKKGQLKANPVNFEL